MINKRFGKIFPIIIGLLLMPVSALAVPSTQPINVDQMLANLQEQIPYLTQFVTAFAYLSGFFFVFGGLYKLKEYGEARTMMSSNTDMRRPLVSLATGTGLIFLPTMVSTSLVTVFGDNSIMQYQGTGTSWDEMGQTIVSIVYFIGGLAFVRGLFHLHRAGTTQQQPGALAKGILHILGGVMAMNIVQVTNIIYTTLGVE